MKFRKKPVVIEAVQWNGDEKMIAAVMDLFGPDGIPHAPDDPHIEAGLGFTPSDGKLYIPTLEGTMTAQPGDFIIRGVKGEVYPCKPDIFAATYESVDPSTPVAAQGPAKEDYAESMTESEIWGSGHDWKYYPTPWTFDAEGYHNGPCVKDAKGNAFVTLFWACHPVEETDAAEQETYRLGKAIASMGAVAAQGQETPEPDPHEHLVGLFNLYTRAKRGLIFSKRWLVVNAMEKAMIAAEAGVAASESTELVWDMTSEREGQIFRPASEASKEK